MKWRSLLGVLIAASLMSGCANEIAGTPTWPGARLEKAVLSPADLPPDVQYSRVIEDPGQPDGARGPAPMLSVPEGCSNGLTDVI
ncbi:MAG: hypothetical protein JO152_01900, partial [Mycobacteriaceae bacterium]|nr:hypothetical protein [Mycobacteriaceae bacterium]